LTLVHVASAAPRRHRDHPAVDCGDQCEARCRACTVATLGSAAARLPSAYVKQVELLRRLRHGGHRVEHVHVNNGRQAVISNVKTRDGDRAIDVISKPET
jgi:hypothetical protein